LIGLETLLFAEFREIPEFIVDFEEIDNLWEGR